MATQTQFHSDHFLHKTRSYHMIHNYLESREGAGREELLFLISIVSKEAWEGGSHCWPPRAVCVVGGDRANDRTAKVQV